MRCNTDLLGTITIQFDDQSSNDILCICTRAATTKGKKNNSKRRRPPEENWLPDTIQQDYIHNKIPKLNSTSLDESQVTPVKRPTSKPMNDEKHDASDSNEDAEVASSCKLCCMSRIFRYLRKKFRRRENNEAFREEHSDTGEGSEILKGGSVPNETTSSHVIPIKNCIDAKRDLQPNTNECCELNARDDNLIQFVLSRMGYAFDVTESANLTPYKRIILRYNESQIRRINKRLFLNGNISTETSICQTTEAKMRLSTHEASPDEEMSPEIQENPRLLKYWNNRYRLFSKFDDGILLDEESWFSVTPEMLAKHIAERCRCDRIIDAFCGAGGNSIQFAFTCERVLAIDIDPEKIRLAKHNAQIYGVADRIEFVVGDFFQLAPMLVGDVVFLSPPWGGPEYQLQETYSLSNILPRDGQSVFKTAKTITDDIAYYLPKNSCTYEISLLDGPGSCVEIEENMLGNRVKALTAYFGELIDYDVADVPVNSGDTRICNYYN